MIVPAFADGRKRLLTHGSQWTAQEDFTDTTILQGFQDSLIRSAAHPSPQNQFFGLSLREIIHEFRHQTLVLVKCLLLQRKMLFFSTKCERVCMLQFALLSLLPGLTAHLEGAAHPSLEIVPSKTSDASSKTARAELLESFGQPLPIFSRGAFFSPYTPLQHLDMLASYSTKSYVVGSTNSLLLQQQSRYADLMVNLDTEPYSITIFSPSLKAALALSAADRRWIDNLCQQVMETWDPENPARPKGMGYAGSEEHILAQFEEYVLSLCSSMVYQVYRERTDGTVQSVLWKDEAAQSQTQETGQETGVVSVRDTKEPPELEDSTKREKTESMNDDANATAAGRTSSATQSRSSSQAARLRAHMRTSSLDAHLPPADLANNAIDFRPEFLAAWRETRNFELFLASLPAETLSVASAPADSSLATDARRPRIFDLIPPAHPTGGGLNIDDVQRRLQQGIEDFKTAYKVDERYKETRENVGKAIEAGREKWGKWWSDMEERRRKAQSENARPVEVSAAAADVDATTAASAQTGEGGGVKSAAAGTPGGAGAGGGGGGGATWAAAFRERASKVQKPDPAAVQAAAKENAAKAGAYLSSWGSWARDKSRDWQQARKSEEGVAAAAAAVPAGSTNAAAAAMSTSSVAVGASASANAAVGSTSTSTQSAPVAAQEGSSGNLEVEPAVKPKRQSVGKFTEDL
jgi:hypothetical protein